MASYLLQENGGKILLEDGTGALLLESSQPTPPVTGKGAIDWRFRRTNRVLIPGVTITTAP